MPSYDLIAIGSPIMDSLVNVSEDYISSIDGEKGGMELVTASEQDELLQAATADIVDAPGGSSANTIFAATKLGLKTAILGKLGNDVVATEYESSYLAMGGSAELFKRGDIANGRCLSMITPDGERTMRTNLGAAMTMIPDDITVEDFAGVSMAHIEGYLLFNQDLFLHVVKCAKSAGCKLSLDLASFEVVNASQSILKDVLRDDIDVVFANEDEVQAFFPEMNDFAQMSQELAKLCSIAVVKLGADGSYVSTKTETIKVSAPYVSKVVDTTGAGDAFAGGFLTSLIREKDLKSCAELGATLGAAVVQVIGAQLSDNYWKQLNNK